MRIINNAKLEENLGLRKKKNGVYYESHHILPKSIFPLWKNKKSNKVLLTAREHFFCHQLLTKIFPSYEMICALFYMCNGNKYQRKECSSREYENIKKDHSKWVSFKKKGKSPWNKGKKCPQLKNPIWMRSEKCRIKRLATLKNKYKEGFPIWNKGISFKELYTKEERKEKFGKNKNKKQSKETIQKRIESLKGQKRTEEQKVHYKAAAEKRTKIYKEKGIFQKIGQINKEKRSIPLYCPELDLKFSSGKEAALYFKTSIHSIRRQIERTKNNKLFKGKYHIFEITKEGEKKMVINHNMSALFANRIEGINNANLQGSMEKLSSGKRINSAKDDASGLAVSTSLNSKIRGLHMASKNITDGTSMLNVASGYMQETTDILQRIRELAVQSSNGVYTDEQRGMMQVEVSQLVDEISRVSSQASFNGMQLLDKDDNTISLHIGSDMDQRITFDLPNLSAEALGFKGGQDGSSTLSIADADSANMAIGTIDEAIKTVSRNSALIGANQNRMEMASKGINIAAENLTAADSQIEDLDMAQGVVDYTRNSILHQSSLAVLAQANSSSQNVLALLR